MSELLEWLNYWSWYGIPFLTLPVTHVGLSSILNWVWQMAVHLINHWVTYLLLSRILLYLLKILLCPSNSVLFCELIIVLTCSESFMSLLWNRVSSSERFREICYTRAKKTACVTSTKLHATHVSTVAIAAVWRLEWRKRVNTRAVWIRNFMHIAVTLAMHNKCWIFYMHPVLLTCSVSALSSSIHAISHSDTRSCIDYSNCNILWINRKC